MTDTPIDFANAPRIPVSHKSVAELDVIMPCIDRAMRGVEKCCSKAEIGVSRRRDTATLNGVLPNPPYVNRFLFVDGTSRKLTDYDRNVDGYSLDTDVEVVERHHFMMRYNARLKSAAGFLIRPFSFLAFYQAAADQPSSAELLVRPQVGGHAALDEIEDIKRVLPYLAFE